MSLGWQSNLAADVPINPIHEIKNEKIENQHENWALCLELSRNALAPKRTQQEPFEKLARTLAFFQMLKITANMQLTMGQIAKKANCNRLENQLFAIKISTFRLNH